MTKNTARIIFSDGSRSWANRLNDLRERWSIRKEAQTKKEWMPVELFRQDLKSKTRQELLDMHGDLMELRKTVRQELRTAEYDAAVRKIYLPHDQFKDMHSAYDAIGIHQQAIQAELSLRPIVRKSRITVKPLHDYFMNIAKERLSKETFYEWLNEAQSRLDESEKLARGQ